MCKKIMSNYDEDMKKESILMLGVIFLVVVSVAVATNILVALPQDASAGERKAEKKGEKKEMVFRRKGGTNTRYFSFKPDGKYVFLSREHLFTAVLDKGRWQQQADGKLVLTSEAKKTKGRKYHFTPTSYKGWVFLASEDHPFINIDCRTPKDGKREIDQNKSKYPPYGLFVVMDVEKFRCEVKTPQPFIFYPEMNKPHPHPVIDMTKD